MHDRPPLPDGQQSPPPAGSPPPPPPPPPPPSSAPPSSSAPPPLAAAPPSPPPSRPAAATSAGPGQDDELADLLDRLHAEIDAETPAPVAPVGAPLTKPTDVSRPSPESVAVVESAGGLQFRPTFASFWSRFVGFIVDSLILTLWLVPGALLVATGSVGFVLFGLVIVLAGFVAATAMYARAVSARGESVGDRLMSIKVVDARNGSFISTGDAAARFVTRQLISIVLFIGFLTAFTNSQRRTFHDRVAGTVVIRPPRESWSIEDESTTEAVDGPASGGVQ